MRKHTQIDEQKQMMMKHTLKDDSPNTPKSDSNITIHTNIHTAKKSMLKGAQRRDPLRCSNSSNLKTSTSIKKYQKGKLRAKSKVQIMDEYLGENIKKYFSSVGKISRSDGADRINLKGKSNINSGSRVFDGDDLNCVISDFWEAGGPRTVETDTQRSQDIFTEEDHSVF